MSAVERSPVIAVDVNGADDPRAAIAGARDAAESHGVRVLLFGAGVAAFGGGLIEAVEAPISVAKDPDPARAVRREPESSIVQAARAVADGRADALVSGG